MSGKVGGAIGGGVTGAMIGSIWGPYGAAIGFVVGAAVGAIITPAVSTSEVSAPDTMDISAPTANEGDAVPDLIGTSQFSNAVNFIWYNYPRTEEVTEDSGSGKGGGGGDSYVSGYQYFLSFAIGICLGPVDKLWSIYENDLLLWSSGASPLTVDDATNGHVELTISGRGTIDFYFGTLDQPANTLMSGDIGYSLPLRGFCYAVFNDFMIGSYNRVGSMKFAISKFPEQSFYANFEIGDYDCNPINSIKYICKKCGIDSTVFDDTEAASVAAVLFAEGRGLSGILKGNNQAIDYLEQELFHIRGVLRVSEDGLLQPLLLRNDIDTGDMLVINDEDILEEINFNKNTGDENQINGSYTKVN